MSTSYSIGDLATEFGITTRTIRFYEEKQLLKPRRRGQIRTFSAADRVRLKLILRGKRLGLSLDESAEIIQMYQPGADNKKQLETLVEKIRAKRTQLEQRQRDLVQMLQDLQDAENRCLGALDHAF